jgi:hypothetical protein
VSLFALCFDLLKNSKSIEAQLQQLLGISEETDLFETIRSLIIEYKKVCLVIRDDIFIERAVSILRNCRSEMTELAKGHLTVRTPNNLSIVSVLVRKAKKMLKQSAMLILKNIGIVRVVENISRKIKI